jgi:hypothetical protein
MKAIEFAYYLQGYFEINGGEAGLTGAQAKTVLKKAESVTHGQGAAEEATQAFAAFTKGVLFTAGRVNRPAPELMKAITDDLKQRLNDLFVHAIDPTVPGDQTAHRKTHRPEGARSDMLC